MHHFSPGFGAIAPAGCGAEGDCRSSAGRDVGCYVGCMRATTSTYRRTIATTTMGNYLGTQSRSLRRHERRPSYAHTAAPVLGPRAVTPRVAANTGPSVDVSSTASFAAPTGRVPVVLGALSSSPVHRALVLVLGTNIAVLLDCSKSSRQCSLYYLLTYLPVVSVLCCSTHGLYPFILLMHSLASFSRISYFRLGFVLVRAEHGPEICDGIGQGGLLQY